MDIKIPVELPAIDLSSAVPIIALVVLAALILFTLTARSLIQSKALALVALAAIIIGGSSSIVGGLQAVAGLILVAGLVAIGLIVVLGRNREVLDIVRTAVERPAMTVERPTPPQLPDVVDTTYRLPAAGQTTASRRRTRSGRIPPGMGF